MCLQNVSSVFGQYVHPPRRPQCICIYIYLENPCLGKKVIFPISCNKRNCSEKKALFKKNVIMGGRPVYSHMQKHEAISALTLQKAAFERKIRKVVSIWVICMLYTYKFLGPLCLYILYIYIYICESLLLTKTFQETAYFD